MPTSISCGVLQHSLMVEVEKSWFLNNTYLFLSVLSQKRTVAFYEPLLEPISWDHPPVNSNMEVKSNLRACALALAFSFSFSDTRRPPSHRFLEWP